MISEDEIDLFFPVAEHEDALEKWEEIFFENKKHFLQFAPIPRVFRAKLKKLEKVYSCYLAKVGQEYKKKKAVEYHPEKFSQEVLNAFNEYQKRRTINKQRLLASNDYFSLASVLENWFADEKEYYSLWQGFDDLELESLIGKETDPMYIISSIKEWSENESKTFDQLRKDKFGLSEILQKEAKRLNLLYNSN